MEDVNVSVVPRINSRMLSANKLPIVFKEKKATITHMQPLINLFSLLLFIKDRLISKTITIKTLRTIEKPSKVFISSTLLSLPAQTLSNGICSKNIKKWNTKTDPSSRNIIFKALCFFICNTMILITKLCKHSIAL